MAPCAAAIVHRNHFFHLFEKDKSSESQVKFRQASNRCKMVLEAPNLHMLIKQSPSLPRNLDLGTSGIANSVLNKGKSAIPPQFNGPVVLPSASDKAKLFAENSSKNSSLDSGIPLPVFPSRTNLKLDNISVTPKMVEKGQNEP